VCAVTMRLCSPWSSRQGHAHGAALLGQGHPRPAVAWLWPGRHWPLPREATAAARLAMWCCWLGRHSCHTATPTPRRGAATAGAITMPSRPHPPTPVRCCWPGPMAATATCTWLGSPSSCHLWHYGRVGCARSWTHVVGPQCLRACLPDRVSRILPRRGQAKPHVPLSASMAGWATPLNPSGRDHLELIRRVAGFAIKSPSHLTPPRLGSSPAKLQFWCFLAARSIRPCASKAGGNSPSNSP